MIGANAPAGSDDQIGQITTVPSGFAKMMGLCSEVGGGMLEDKHPCMRKKGERRHE
jgi:hypothetical protein